MYENINVNELVKRYQEGDKSTFDDIYEAEKKQIWSIIKTYRSYDRDDIKQTALEGLLIAIETFDANENVKFNTYVYTIIRNQVNMFVRKNNNTNKKYKVISAESSVEDDEDDLTLLDIIESDDNIEEIAIKNEEKARLYNAIDLFEEKNKMKGQIVRLLLQNLTQNQIAEIVGCNRSYVSRIRTQFINYAKTIA